MARGNRPSLCNTQFQFIKSILVISLGVGFPPSTPFPQPPACQALRSSLRWKERGRGTFGSRCRDHYLAQRDCALLMWRWRCDASQWGRSGVGAMGRWPGAARSREPWFRRYLVCWRQVARQAPLSPARPLSALLGRARRCSRRAACLPTCFVLSSWNEGHFARWRRTTVVWLCDNVAQIPSCGIRYKRDTMRCLGITVRAAAIFANFVLKMLEIGSAKYVRSFPW